MDTAFYLAAFQEAAGDFDPTLLSQKQLDLETGVWLDSVVLRLQKKNWANQPALQPQSDAAIFFSVWVNNKTLSENNLFYNIHALKLRQLKGYSLISRAFATAFREQFKPFEQQWPNVSTDFGPLTLMEGWEVLPATNISKTVYNIARKFLAIDTLIDDLLAEHKKTTI